RHVWLGGNLGSAGCPVLPGPHHLLSNVRHDVAIAGTFKLLHGPAVTQTFANWSARFKSRRWRNSVAVFLLRNSTIKLHLQLWLNRATRFLNLKLLSEFEFNQALARS